MAIDWNNVAAPNLGESNSLFAQAIQSLKDAGIGLKDTAKDYQTVVRNKSHAILQEYINSAKTPEELQSEAFNTGFKNLQATLANEYDAVKVNDYRDSAVDTLLSRKANQVSIDTNQFNLDTGRKNQLTKETTNKILAAPPEQRDALKQAAVDANAFDASAYQQYVQGEGTIRNQNNVDKLFNATYNANVENANLAPEVTRHGMKIADGQLAVSQQNATANMLQAKAAAAKAEAEKKNTKNNYIATGLAAIDTARKAVKEKVYGSGLSTDPTKTLKYWKDESTAGLDSFDAAPDYIYEAITKHPELSKLPQNIQQLFAQNTLSGVRDSENFSRPFGVMSGAEKAKVHELLTEEYKNFNQQVKTAEDNATIPIYRKTVFEHAQKTGATGYAAAKDLGLDELTIYKAGISSQLAAQAKIKYASSDKSIPENQFIENEINIATNPDYAASNAPLFPKPKQEAANVPAQSSRTFLNSLATGSYEDKVALIGSELKKTRDPIQIAFLNNELKKLEKDAPPVTANTSNSLQEQQQRMEAAALARLTAAALKQNGRPPVTPALTAKPEETKPRELTPADPSQEPSALAAQEQRINNRARLNLEAQKALQNGQPFIVPAITDKPVADPLWQAALEQPPVATNNTSQPRQLPPAEIAQKERMQQTALSNLIGAKLEEKQALVRNAFPNASLTPINKATEPLSNNSIPLIQSMFKLPVATDNTSQPKSINKAATAEAKEVKQSVFPDTPLKQLAKAATPVPSPLIPVESQNAFRVKENNLALDFLTGKGTPTKEPVPMPKVTWKEPVQAVTINPIYAQLPQYKATVTYVPDGDTLRAKSKDYKTTGLSDINCRIDSIDTPETAKPQYGKKGQPYGEEAAKILERMVLNKEISIRVTKPTDGKSNNGRDVCQIEVAGKDVSVELLRAGAAWLYKEYNHYEESGFDLESAARKNKLGLWGLPNPVYPQDFRHNGYQNP